MDVPCCNKSPGYSVMNPGIVIDHDTRLHLQHGHISPNTQKRHHIAHLLGARCGAYINLLAPGRPGCHFETAIFNLVLLIGIFTSSKDDALRWMPRDLTDKSTLVHVMTWCRQATSHYLSQCWTSSMPPYGVTRPQWVNYILLSASYIFTYHM